MMEPDSDLTRDEAQFVEILRAMRPIHTRIDRDSLMYRAGRAAGRRYRAVWPGVAGLLAVALIVSALVGPPAQIGEPVQPGRPQVATDSVGAETEWPDVQWSPPNPEGYLRLRNEVLEKGLDALPQPRITDANGHWKSWRNSLPDHLRRRRTIEESL